MSFFTALVGSKIALGALTLGTLAAGGTAAAAYTGNLPTDMQETAHTVIGAPAPGDVTGTSTPTADLTSTPDPTSTPVPTVTPVPTATAGPVGPDATGPAAFGLCTAYAHGGLSTTSVAYGSLEKAAGGATSITTYCATIVSPGHSATQRPAPTSGVTAGHSHKPSGAGSHPTGGTSHGSSSRP